MMAIHNTQGEDLTTQGFLSPRELAGIIIESYNNGSVNDLINCESVELSVQQVDRSDQQAQPRKVKLITFGIWDVMQWINEVQCQGYELGNEGHKYATEIFFVDKIRAIFPDDYSNSKLPLGYKWASPTNDS